MEGLIHALLIQRTLHRLVEETLIHITVVRAECRREDLVANIESVNDTDDVWTKCGEHLLETRLERGNIFII